MSFVSEFKEIAVKGNVIDLAVGVVIGGGFGKIVDSLVKDVVMPVVGWLVGGVDFKDLYFSLDRQSYATLAAAEKSGAPVVRYGLFVNSVVDFFIIALVIFSVIKLINRLKRPPAPAPVAEPPTPEDILLLRDIRDSLRRQGGHGTGS